MRPPVAETPPQGLDAYWLGVWRHVLKTLKAQQTWAWELKPLVDEYVFALIAAEEARKDGEGTKWDRHSKRAHQLAHTLILTPEARKRHGIGEADQPADPLAEFDELAARRRSA